MRVLAFQFLIFLTIFSLQPLAYAQLGNNSSIGQRLNVLRTTELRTDKLGSAPVIASLSTGTALRLLSVEGGWAWVEATSATKQNALGWVRASALDWKSGNSIASSTASGRETSGNTALTLGVRGEPPRVNRHALIIGLSRYADPSRPPLPGARIDKESATQMAQAMQVPFENIQYLQDEQATGNNIRQAIKDLTAKVMEGDRVFIHFSGHGTRYKDPATGSCVEALLGYDSGWESMITNREMSNLIEPMTNKTDKLFVMYDACYSGGVALVSSSVRTRGFSTATDEGLLRPKFSVTSDECSRPVNVRVQRNLLVEAVEKGALPQDIVHLSAARDNEMSFDDELKGGLATQFMRDCMLRDAKDLDNSGAISIDEIKICAQSKVDQRLANDTQYTSPHLVLNGNSAFVPVWFSKPNSVTVTTVAAAPASPTVSVPTVNIPTTISIPPTIQTDTSKVKPPSLPAPPSTTTSIPASQVPANTAQSPVVVPQTQVSTSSNTTASPTLLTGEKALIQMFDQRDAKRRVKVSLAKSKLKIGQDLLDFSVQSDRAGYVYVAMAGSDNKSLNLLFPNDLDQNNKIEAGQQLMFPRANWRIKAGGPEGLNNLFIMVADAPRDLKSLEGQKAGPFIFSLNDPEGRAKLGALMTTSQMVGTQSCKNITSRQKNPLCSDAYGAAMVAVEEVK